MIEVREETALDACPSVLIRCESGGTAVVCADSRMRRLFDTTLLSQGFRVYATLEEALAG